MDADAKREQILDRLGEMPGLPPAVPRAISLACCRDVDFDDLARSIEIDPGMTANMLRLAQSAYFGGLHPPKSVREAIGRMGAQNVCRLLIASSTAPKMKVPLAGYDMPPGALLEQSIARALAAQALAESLDVDAPEHLFTAALLADCGKIALGGFLAVDAGPIVALSQEKEIPFDEAERHILGIDHGEASAKLLESWGLPDDLAIVARFRLRPDIYAGDDPAVDLTHIADCIAKMIGAGLGLDGLTYTISTRATERLGVSAEVVEAVMAKVMDDLEPLREIFGGMS
jgi:HD-like signal output (HDOD) protein